MNKREAKALVDGLYHLEYHDGSWATAVVWQDDGPRFVATVADDVSELRWESVKSAELLDMVALRAAAQAVPKLSESLQVTAAALEKQTIRANALAAELDTIKTAAAKDRSAVARQSNVIDVIRGALELV
jgi:hypothetical protein